MTVVRIDNTARVAVVRYPELGGEHPIVVESEPGRGSADPAKGHAPF